MTLKHLLAGAAVFASLAAFATARAATPTIVGSEGANGFTGNLIENQFPGTNYLVASDGETPFMPFGATFDVSDGLNFANVGFVWNQASDSNWTNIGSQTWVLPASTPCGSENEPKCEPVGHFVSPSAWAPSLIGSYEILEGPNGGLSDIIILSNTDAGADLKFFSDPIGVPEPATWAIMLAGLGGIGVAMRAARSSKVAVAA